MSVSPAALSALRISCVTSDSRMPILVCFLTARIARTVTCDQMYLHVRLRMVSRAQNQGLTSLTHFIISSSSELLRSRSLFTSTGAFRTLASGAAFCRPSVIKVLTSPST